MGNQIFGMTVFAQSKTKTSFEPDMDPDKPPCRACTDFKSWAKFQSGKKKESMDSGSGTGVAGKSDTGQGTNAEDDETALLAQRAHLQCPLDKDELGRATWSFLHTMAAYFPDNPSHVQQKEMSAFVKIFSKYYPCEHCAKDFQMSIKESPPETSNRIDFSRWMCKMHNEVNRKLGKPEFNCDRVDERWKDGWKDGSCDI